MTTRWYLGVIALRWWQASRLPADSKIGKHPGCAPEVGRLGLMRVVQREYVPGAEAACGRAGRVGRAGPPERGELAREER